MIARPIHLSARARGVAATALLAVLTLAVGTSSALPMYAARVRKPCVFCHINPGGGGPRNIRGQFFARNDHQFPDPIPTMNDIRALAAAGQQSGPAPVASHESFWDRVNLSSTIIMAHTLTSGDRDGSGDCESCHASPNLPHNKLMLMSGQVSLAVRASEKLTLFLSQDMGIAREAYALYEVVPQLLNVRAGLFVVPFGLKMRDHSTLVKSKMGVGSNLRDVGVAAQGTGGVAFYEASYTRGGNVSPTAPPVRSFGGSDPTVSVTGGIRWAGAQFGAAFMKRRGSFIDRYDVADVTFRPGDNPDGYDQLRYGAFGSYTLGPLTVEGELVYGADEETRTPRLGDPEVESFPRLGTYASVMLSPLPRFDLGARYEFFDPSRDHADDAVTHYVFFGEFDVAPNVSIEGRFRLRRESTSVQVDNNDFITLLKVRL